MSTIQTRDGTNIYVKEWGEGRPVVLIHGWPLSADSWDPQMNVLADNGFRVVAYDRRGFGRSDQPGTGNEYDTYADDLADVLAAKGLTDDVALVGFSMGGGEIARYMSRHGGKGISRAVFISSVAGYMLKGPDNPNGVPQETFDEMTKAMKEDFRKFFTDFFQDFYGRTVDSASPVSDEQLHWAWQTTMHAGLRNILQAANAFATTDFRPDLDRVKVPSLVIHGTADKTVPIEATGHVVAQKVPGAKLIEYEGEPHAVFATQQDRLTQDLLDFLCSDRVAPDAGVETLEAAR